MNACTYRLTATAIALIAIVSSAARAQVEALTATVDGGVAGERAALAVGSNSQVCGMIVDPRGTLVGANVALEWIDLSASGLTLRTGLRGERRWFAKSVEAGEPLYLFAPETDSDYVVVPREFSFSAATTTIGPSIDVALNPISELLLLLNGFVGFTIDESFELSEQIPLKGERRTGSARLADEASARMKGVVADIGIGAAWRIPIATRLQLEPRATFDWSPTGRLSGATGAWSLTAGVGLRIPFGAEEPSHGAIPQLPAGPPVEIRLRLQDQRDDVAIAVAIVRSAHLSLAPADFFWGADEPAPSDPTEERLPWRSDTLLFRSRLPLLAAWLRASQERKLMLTPHRHAPFSAEDARTLATGLRDRLVLDHGIDTARIVIGRVELGSSGGVRVEQRGPIEGAIAAEVDRTILPPGIVIARRVDADRLDGRGEITIAHNDRIVGRLSGEEGRQRVEWELADSTAGEGVLVATISALDSAGHRISAADTLPFRVVESTIALTRSFSLATGRSSATILWQTPDVTTGMRSLEEVVALLGLMPGSLTISAPAHLEELARQLVHRLSMRRVTLQPSNDVGQVRVTVE